MKTVRHLVLAVAGSVVMGMAASPASASPSAYSSIVAFGDSLSDNGNFAALVGGLFPSPAYGYAQGRFSNGPVAVEYLAQSLGIGLTDFAVGGARTGPSLDSSSDNYADDSGEAAAFGLPANYFNGTGVRAQVDAYLALTHNAADANALYFVWAGPNDFFLPASLINPQTAANALDNLQLSITTLYAAGARSFLVPNMANLGLTPALLGEGSLASGLATYRSVEYNTGLALMLGQLGQNLAGAQFHSADVFDLLNSAGVNPGQYGLTDVTTPCQTLAGCPADPAGYLFWDDVHITTAGHQIVAGAFAAALAPVPEAQTWAMLLAGLALLGLARRARG